MIRWLKLAAALCLLAVAGCDQYEEVEYETGYKGKARLNPWLAAERFAAEFGYDVDSLTAWRAPTVDDAVWFVPASVLNNESFVRKAEEWVREGGHLVVLLDHAGVEISDWRSFNTEVEAEAVLESLLERAGITLTQRETGRKSWATESQVIEFDGENYRIEAGAGKQVADRARAAGMFASTLVGSGRISAIADARVFRNRWIGDQDHAAFLLALLDVGEYDGRVMFSRGSSLSLWGMIRHHLWAVLLGLLALLGLWLWKNLVRFGPLESAQPPTVARSYDHHLEALGSFHWRIDRATALLAPLRERILEHSLRSGQRSGRAAGDIHLWLAERSGLSAERIAAALDPRHPADGVALTRITADLQLLHQSLH